MVLISGIAVVDFIASGLSKVAKPGEVAFGSIRASLGGHACNLSIDLVQLGFPRTKLRAIFPVGGDIFGQYLIKKLRNSGIKVEPVITDENPTSLNLILVTRKEDRRYHADPGANLSLSPAHIVPLLEKDRPRLFYLGGAGILEKLDKKLASVMKKARDVGSLTFVDVVSPLSKNWDYCRRAMPHIDLFHCNTDEAVGLTGERTAEKQIERLYEKGARHVFLTRGDKGVLARVPGARLSLPGFAVSVTDPTGAGDAFCAGLILKIHQSLSSGSSLKDFLSEDWRDVLLFASACGAVCCKGIGTTTSVEKGGVDRLIRRKGQALVRSFSARGVGPPQSL